MTAGLMSPPPLPPPGRQNDNGTATGASGGDEDDEGGPDFFSSTPPAAQLSQPAGLSLFRGDDDEEDDRDEDDGPGGTPALMETSMRSPKRARLDDGSRPAVLDSLLETPAMSRASSASSAASGSSGSSSSSSARIGEWDRRYIGNFVTSAWSLSKGSNYIKPGDHVLIQRQKPKVAAAATHQQQSQPPGKGASKAGPGGAGNGKKQSKLVFGAQAPAPARKAKQKEDYIVRFSNTRGFEVGRIPSDVSVWMSKVLDLDAASFEGVVVDCPPSLTVGCDLLLEIRAYILRSAYTSNDELGSTLRNDDAPVSAWGSETAESEEEKRLRERKTSLVRLFRACTLRPSVTNAAALGKGKNGQEDSANDDVAPSSSRATSPEPQPSFREGVNGAHPPNDTAGRRSSSPEEADDGTEVTGKQLESVYDRAQLHDFGLPEVEPSDGFALTLRPYQKQALGWMLKMEEKPRSKRSRKANGNDQQSTRELSLHPLWEEYIFPVDDARMDLLDSATSRFYFNPYTGHLSLKFQAASRGARGGILADEMGLGKTIQMASLIWSNQPKEDEPASDFEDEEQQGDAADRSGKMRQTSLAKSFAATGQETMDGTQRRKAVLKTADASKGRVTLVVAPMSLVGQWRDEMERAIPSMTTMLYYAETKGDLVSRLEGGTVDIVVTSYGTLVTEYKRLLDTKGQHAERVAPLYAIDWLRVILDEAHHVKNKMTKNSRACRDLLAHRRWCLTGTPIVNRLTDLFSLLRFLRVEPWGDFAFFNSFIAKPFMQKNPKALEIVQVILESVLMRREKRMKGKDGRPIIELPPKTSNVVRLSFSPLERKIYESVYDRAYMQYQTLAAAGTISRNFTFIFSVLMRLRQAVCHPLLVLKGAKTVTKVDENTPESEDAKSVLGEAEEKVRELVAAFQSGSDSVEASNGTEKLSTEALEELFKQEAAEDGGDTECPFCFEEKSELYVMPCKHWGCKSCVIDHLQRSEDRGEDEATCPTCRKGPITLGNISSVVRTRRHKLTDVIEGSQGKEEDANSDDAPSSQPALYFGNNDFRSSTKLEALAAHLNQLRYDDPSFKGVIFSQFTSFLDLVEVVLRRNHHAFVRLDGTTSQKDREAVLKEFATAPRRMLMLVSLRAGGVGLNLTAANHVWLLDCWWNSSTEDQAVDRIHRMGQTRPVFVHRFLIDDSIEDRILAIQARKTALVGAALAGSRGEEEKSEALQNLELLFS